MRRVRLKMQFVTTGVRDLAIIAGWSPTRAVRVPEQVPWNHPAAEVLHQFAGLIIRPQSEAGEECATSSVAFEYLPNTSDILEWEGQLGCDLVQVAETDAGDSFLFVGTCGCCFGSSAIHRAFYLVAPSFPEALENLLVGRRSRPMLAHDQEFVGLYGVRFARGHPAIWTHAHQAQQEHEITNPNAAASTQ
jgi:hypothetical protein